ncbi:MAG: hypothetical protein ACR2PW_04175 [Gammaproteobacteria bacterium]
MSAIGWQLLAAVQTGSCMLAGLYALLAITATEVQAADAEAARIWAPAQFTDRALAQPAQLVYRKGRYRLGTPQALQTVSDPLEDWVEADWLAVSDAGEAIEILLQGTGYRLVKDAQTIPMERSSLASSQRTLPLMSVRNALRVMGGNQWDLVQDPVHRLIYYELLPPWRLRLYPQKFALDWQLPRLFMVRKSALNANLRRLMGAWGRNDGSWSLSAADAVHLDTVLDEQRVFQAMNADEAFEQLLHPVGLHASVLESERLIYIERLP